MKLYYSPGTCSLASHIVLRETGRPFELEKVNTAAKKTEHGKDYLTINAKGVVPALEHGQGEILTEGAAIMQYIADTSGAETLAPKPGTLARARVQELLNFTASELHKAFSPLFSAKSGEDAKAEAKANVAKKFDWIESRLADGRKHLTGEAFTVADAYVFTVTNWANFTGIALDRWPKLKAFFERVRERASVKAAMRAEGLV